MAADDDPHTEATRAAMLGFPMIGRRDGIHRQGASKIRAALKRYPREAEVSARCGRFYFSQ
jgi:hypothetical protein